MSTVMCVRCASEGQRLAFQPFQNDLGARAYREICSACWGEWLRLQQQLINHYGLNLREPKSKQFLFENMDRFLFQGEQQVVQGEGPVG
ncbi:MAG: oxidative damage protection protein [Gemmatimonadales bacterium]|nr:oxidative damage protection protein [Gemmatimonadales bacterium]